MICWTTVAEMDGHGVARGIDMKGNINMSRYGIAERQRLKERYGRILHKVRACVTGCPFVGLAGTQEIDCCLDPGVCIGGEKQELSSELFIHVNMK